MSKQSGRAYKSLSEPSLPCVWIIHMCVYMYVYITLPSLCLYYSHFCIHVCIYHTIICIFLDKGFHRLHCVSKSVFIIHLPTCMSSICMYVCISLFGPEPSSLDHSLSLLFIQSVSIIH